MNENTKKQLAKEQETKAKNEPKKVKLTEVLAELKLDTDRVLVRTMTMLRYNDLYNDAHIYAEKFEDLTITISRLISNEKKIKKINEKDINLSYYTEGAKASKNTIKLGIEWVKTIGDKERKPIEKIVKKLWKKVLESNNFNYNEKDSFETN